MSTLIQPGTPINLANCAAEPIHIPGSIQPHGVLLAFTLNGLLAIRSANASMLGALPAEGQPLAAEHLTADIRDILRAATTGGTAADTCEVALPDGRLADLTTHVHEDLLFAEFEPRESGIASAAAGAFALIAQRAISRFQRQVTIDALLEAGVEEVATLSGFDRVMAYRFHPDDSGEIVAERCAKPLEPFLGLRYPASDIPPQARRLFILNPLRLIVDVAYQPVPLVPDRNPLTGGHLDLSHSVLRSVSPIHCEYLGNMGVHGSMAVSIVVQGRLWGMFSCHHYAPLLVNATVRMACRLLSQIVSLMVERLLATQRAAEIERGLTMRSSIIERVRASDYMLRALTAGSPTAMDVVSACGLAAGTLEQLQVIGDVPARAQLAQLLDWLERRNADSFATSAIARESPELAEICAGFAGLFAVRFSTERNCWLVWFRREQVQTRRWAGDPEKPAMLGPNGLRLSPRGSFTEWRQEVRCQSEPWTDAEAFDAHELRRALTDISAARLQEVVRAREMLLAMLGHDLRTPLLAIAMAGAALRTDEAHVKRVQTQIARISGRMGRMINHVLDLSRMHAGFGLIRQREPRDLTELLNEISTDSRSADPLADLITDIPTLGLVNIDTDRMTQVFTNLVSNARHHGLPDRPVVFEAVRTGNEVQVRVINHGPPLTEQTLESMFEPFKRGSIDNPDNPRGLGMGLYIASTIVREHGGKLLVDSEDGLVTFTVTLPVERQ